MAKLVFAMKLYATGMSLTSIKEILSIGEQTEISMIGIFWATIVVPRIPTKRKKIWA